MWIILLLYLLLASTFTIGKAALCFIQPILFVAIRMLLGGGLLLSFFRLVLGRQIVVERKDFWLFIQLVTFHIYLSFTFEFLALVKVSSAKAALIFSLSPFITALLSIYYLKESLSVKKWIGLLIGFCGLIPWIITQSFGEYNNLFLAFSESECLLLLAVITASYGWILVKKLVHASYSPILLNGIAMFGGGILALFTSFLLEDPPYLMYTVQTCPTDAPGVGFLVPMIGYKWAQIALISFYTLLLIFIANVIFYNLYSYLLRRYSPTFLSFAGFTCPIFAAFFGWAYLGESISIEFIMSLFIVFLGLYLFYQEELITKKPVS